VGKEVTHVKEGDHVISTWVSRVPIRGLPVSKHTGATFRGRPLIADGDVYTWSEHMVTFGDKVVPMSPSDPTDISCLIGCAVLTGAGAVLHTAKVARGQSVAVFGVGGVGLSAIAAAAIAGADPIIAVDLVDRKLQFAKEFGATHGVNASNTDAVKAIWAINPGGVDYALDAVGAPTTALQILQAVRQGGPRADNQGGMAVLIGIPVADITVDLKEILLYQRHYCGSLGATKPETDFPLFLEWMREDKFPLEKLVTNRYSLEQANEACIALQEEQILGRAIIEL
jgi:S-(hydroxymethyl)glutathione dehydrogenase/alcohol dehydrogenase